MDREQLMARLKWLWDFLEKDETGVKWIYGRALRDHSLKYLRAKLDHPCTYKQFLLDWFGNLSNKLKDDEVIKIIAGIESKFRVNTDREYEKFCAQCRKQFSGRQRGRAYKSFHDH
jgi:hypothetical protein